MRLNRFLLNLRVFVVIFKRLADMFRYHGGPQTFHQNTLIISTLLESPFV